MNQFLFSLAPAQWEADYGVRYEGGAVTIRNTVDALIHDYIEHREQIEEWVKSHESA